MLYAVQGNHIRWIFSAEEDHHLFEQFDMINATVDIQIRGNWNEGFIFKPVISQNGRYDRPNGPFPVQKMPQSEIRSIVTSFEFLKVNRIVLKDIREQAEIQCNRSRNTRELMVYPKHVIDKDHPPRPYNADNVAAEIARTLQDELEAEARNRRPDVVTEQPQPTVDHNDVMRVAASLGFLPDEVDDELTKVLSDEMKLGKHTVPDDDGTWDIGVQAEAAVEDYVDTIIDEAPNVQPHVAPVYTQAEPFPPLPEAENEDENIALARMIILDLNPILAANPGLMVQITDDGKSIKLVREVIKWRKIV